MPYTYDRPREIWAGFERSPRNDPDGRVINERRKNPSAPRWVRDRRRFDDTNLRVRVILGDLDALTKYILDIRPSLEYYEDKNQARFYELRERITNGQV
jgi:hypothetical protein